MYSKVTQLDICVSVCVCIYIFFYRLFSTKGYNNAWHRSGSCMAQQLRGATPCPRSGAVAERSYLTSKVRSSGCALLEQP